MAGEPPIPPLAADTTDWLLRQGLQGAGVADLLDRLCRRLVGRGVALDRAFCGNATLHPLLGGRNFSWRADAPSTEVEVYSRDDMLTDAYRSSPFFHLSTHALEFARWRLDRPGDAPPLPLLERLRVQGFADYCAAFHPYGEADNRRFTRGVPTQMLYRNGIGVSFATRRAGGFRDAEVTLFRALGPALALAAKAAETHTLAAFVLDTYLGAGTGRRVLDGEIRRGDGERIEAVIWYSDLRDSTTMAEVLAPDDYLAVVNEYFDCTAGAVLAAKGEVLKLVGDAVLAVFPLGAQARAAAGPCPAEPVAAALAAARDALARLQLANESRLGDGRPPLRAGVALHAGEVMYGNVGSAARLDFTATGRAINEAVRLEALCKELGVPLVTSAAFASRLSGRLRSLGSYELRGMRGRMEVFVPDEPLDRPGG